MAARTTTLGLPSLADRTLAIVVAAKAFVAMQDHAQHISRSNVPE